MKHIIRVIGNNPPSRDVIIDAVSNEDALRQFVPAEDEIILSVEPLWQKEQRDAVTTEKASRDAHLWRKHNG